MTSTPEFSIAIRPSADMVLLCCSGEVDLSNVHLLRELLRQYVADASAEVAVDLREVRYLDSAAIKELVQAAALLRQQGRRLQVKATMRQHTLFVLTGFRGLMALEIV